MTFDYMHYLTKEDAEKPSGSEQSAGQYNRSIAVGRKKEQADPLREAWKNEYLRNKQAPGAVVADPDWQKIFVLSPSSEALTLLDTLPTYSFLLHFTFTLQKPYLSRDDNDFHIIDNPLVREKVFRWPMVRPSGWKGSLSHALWQLGYSKDEEQIQRIFGETRGDNTGRAGRLHLHPTFLNQSSLEVINPHDRKNRVGKNPILMECVPIGSTGAFTLLYVPFDHIGQDARETTRLQVSADMQLIVKGIQAMMTTYGFGAKTSSGFGLADMENGGRLVINYPDKKPQITRPVAPTEPESVRRFRSEYHGDDFSLKPKAWREKHESSKGKQEGFKKAKADWLAYQSQLNQYQKEVAEWETAQETPPPDKIIRTFDSFRALTGIVDQLVETWLGGGEA